MHTTTSPLSRFAAFLRLMGLRYRAGNYLKFVAGVIAGGAAATWYLPLGVVAITIVSTVFMLANRLADRVEDSIDYASRGELFQVIGVRTVKTVMAVMVPLYAVAILPILWFADAPLVVNVLWILYLFVGLSYSYGPRLKARRFGGPLLIAIHGPGLFWVGYAGAGGQFGPEAAAVLVLSFLVPACCAFAKDAPNLEGDSAIGYNSLYRRLAGHLGRTRVVLAIPYLVVLALFAAGVVGPTFLIILVLLPGAEILARVMARAQTLQERKTAPEVSLLYIITMSAAILFAFHPELITVLVGLGALAWYIGITRYLHSEPGLMTWEQAKVAADLVRGRRGATRAT